MKSNKQTIEKELIIETLNMGGKREEEGLFWKYCALFKTDELLLFETFYSKLLSTCSMFNRIDLESKKEISVYVKWDVRWDFIAITGINE